MARLAFFAALLALAACGKYMQSGQTEAIDQTITVSKNAPTTIALRSLSAAGAHLSYTITAPPARGLLSGSGWIYLYQPYPDFTGIDSFQFRVTDGTVTSNGIITLYVISPGRRGRSTSASSVP